MSDGAIVALVSLVVTAILAPLVRWAWKRHEQRQGPVYTPLQTERTVKPILAFERQQLGAAALTIQRFSVPLNQKGLEQKIASAYAVYITRSPHLSEDQRDRKVPMSTFPTMVRDVVTTGRHVAMADSPDPAMRRYAAVTGTFKALVVAIRNKRGDVVGQLAAEFSEDNPHGEDEWRVLERVASQIEHLLPWCNDRAANLEGGS